VHEDATTVQLRLMSPEVAPLSWMIGAGCAGGILTVETIRSFAQAVPVAKASKRFELKTTTDIL
jgi:hypothetical protein